MKTVAALLFLALLTPLQAATPPLQAAPRFTHVVRSKPVKCNGLEFMAAAETKWNCFKPPFGEDDVIVQLYIKNRTSHPIIFPTFDTFGIHIKDAAGHELPVGGGRNKTWRTKVVLLDANATFCLCRKAVLGWNHNGIRTFTYWDGTGTVADYKMPSAGEYTLSFWCQNKPQKKAKQASKFPIWNGEVKTNPVAFKVVDPQKSRTLQTISR